MKKCPKCKDLHEKEGLFCGRSCANSRPKTLDTREKIRLSLVGRIVGKRKEGRRTAVTCRTCGKNFTKATSHVRSRNYCNKACSDADLKRAPNAGGYRQGSGRAKSGYYKGIFCGSTYELAWVYFMLKFKINFKRFEKHIDLPGKGKYFPDFEVDGRIIEIKGYWTPQVDIKTKAAQDAGYQILVLYKKDLAVCFSEVKKDIGNCPIESLFDEFKPAFTYICEVCQNQFFAQRKRPLGSVCCSKECGGKFGRSHTVKEKRKCVVPILLGM